MVAAVLDDLVSVPDGRWHAVRFRQSEASVSLRTDRAEVMQAALDTLYGYRITRLGRAGWDITLHATALVDIVAVAEVFADAPWREVGPRLHARTLSSVRGQTCWVAEHATIIHAEHRTATITAHCPDVQSAWYWAARLVRQAMTAQLLAAGAVYAHAAAFSHRGRGVLVTGHKGAGKTTTLVTSLRLLGANYLTNDRLLLRREGGELVGRPWPAHLRVGIGTLLALPELADLVPAHLCDLPRRQRWYHREKVTIEPPEFSRLLSGGVVLSEVRPRLMLWPSLSPGGNGTGLTAVASGEVHDVLLATRLFMHNPASGVSAHLNHWLIDTAPASETAENLRQVVEDLAATVPCYRLPINGDPMALAARIREVLAPQ
jgi:energy-coupling factor transporter ATP-binding protein EcfA2